MAPEQRMCVLECARKQPCLGLSGTPQQGDPMPCGSDSVSAGVGGVRPQRASRQEGKETVRLWPKELRCFWKVFVTNPENQFCELDSKGTFIRVAEGHVDGGERPAQPTAARSKCPSWFSDEEWRSNTCGLSQVPGSCQQLESEPTKCESRPR